MYDDFNFLIFLILALHNRIEKCISLHIPAIVMLEHDVPYMYHRAHSSTKFSYRKKNDCIWSALIYCTIYVPLSWNGLDCFFGCKSYIKLFLAKVKIVKLLESILDCSFLAQHLFLSHRTPVISRGFETLGYTACNRLFV